MSRLSHLLLGARRWWLNLTKAKDALVDSFRPNGWVELRLIHAHGPRKGEVARIIKGRNIVTSWLSGGGAAPTSGRDMMRRKLVPAALSGSLEGDPNVCLAYCQLGSDGSLEDAGDTGLGSAYTDTEKAVSSVEYDAVNPYVTFVFEYTEVEANYALAEVVFLSARGTTGARDVFSRKTFGEVTKNSDFALQLRYTVRF